MNEPQVTDPTEEQVREFTRWAVNGADKLELPRSTVEHKMAYSYAFLTLCEAIIRRQRTRPHEIPEAVRVCMDVLRQPLEARRNRLLSSSASCYYRELREVS